MANEDENVSAVQSVSGIVAIVKIKIVGTHYLCLRVWRVTNEKIPQGPFLSC
jgi:hypothetical protein